ncbi:hypothetical protein BDW62DRAFT_204730 [Aspergillus aurantiobrunneus]
MQPGAPRIHEKAPGPGIITRRVNRRPSNEKLLIIGVFAEVYLIDGKSIRKLPRSQSEEEMEPIIREATIYNTIGTHPRIAECLSGGRTDYIDVKYYPHGDAAAYLSENELTPALRSKWSQQILEAIFFVDDDLNLRLGDFNSAQCPDHPALGYEKA